MAINSNLNTSENKSKQFPNDAKKVFRRLGTCSRTFTYLLNREFGATNTLMETAADPLAGGLMQRGHQCGMLWGAALAVGAEAHRRNDNVDKAAEMAIKATQHLLESFNKRTSTVNCRDFTHCDFSSKLSMAKYFFTGRFLKCFKLAEVWAPEAIEAAHEGLNNQPQKYHPALQNCASNLASKTGASNEEIVTVSGFAGGLGLSGGACGALSAAVWLNSLTVCRQKPKKSAYPNAGATATLKAFENITSGELLCHKISGRQFQSIDEHTEFVKNGGCNSLINTLALAQNA